MINRKLRYLALISLLLILGFSAISLVSFYVANHSLQLHIRSNTLPLTSDNIYSEIQRDILPTIVISSLMAQDTFVREWVVAGERDAESMRRYLASIQQQYQTTTAFFVSDISRNYYHPSGILKQVSPEDPADAWYFRVKPLQAPFEINVDLDTADRKRTSLFINHKVFDFDGRYIGAIGVGLSSEIISKLIDAYQQRYGREVFFIDVQGRITMHGGQLSGVNSIQQLDGVDAIVDALLASDGGSYSYQRDGQNVFLNTRLIPELKWHVVVQHVEQAEPEVRNTLWINLLLSIIITVVVVALVNLAINKYQRRLEDMATRDKLTGLDNRHVIEANTRQALLNADRRREPLCAVLVDIDHFKAINDKYGHLSGDQVIAYVAKQLQIRLRDTDLIGRWGGEEFLLLLPGCNIGQALHVAEQLRQQIADTAVPLSKKSLNLTVSLGVAEYQRGESSETLFHHADQALYQAKAEGRNRVVSYANRA